MTKEMRNKGLVAESSLIYLACEVIRHAKEGSDPFAKHYYSMLQGACLVYLDFFEDAGLNRVQLAQNYIERLCKELGEDYEKIMRFVLHLSIAQ